VCVHVTYTCTVVTAVAIEHFIKICMLPLWLGYTKMPLLTKKKTTPTHQNKKPTTNHSKKKKTTTKPQTNKN